MKKRVLLVILEQFADWEAAYLASAVHLLNGEAYTVETVSLTKESVRSIGGFRVVPDYDLSSAPPEYAGLFLIGGLSWRTEEARQVEPLVKSALQKRRIVGGICDASGFLGTIGALNGARHTSNDLDDLKRWAGGAYTGAANYQREQAVRDGGIVTANGTAPMEFAREAMLAMEAASEKKIWEWFQFHKLGYYNAPYPEM